MMVAPIRNITSLSTLAGLVYKTLFHKAYVMQFNIENVKAT